MVKFWLYNLNQVRLLVDLWFLREKLCIQMLCYFLKEMSMYLARVFTGQIIAVAERLESNLSKADMIEKNTAQYKPTLFFHFCM